MEICGILIDVWFWIKNIAGVSTIGVMIYPCDDFSIRTPRDMNKFDLVWKWKKMNTIGFVMEVEEDEYYWCGWFYL